MVPIRHRTSYYLWLVDLVNGRKARALLDQLYLVVFYSRLPNDDNRVVDGQKMRERFEIETGFDFGDSDEFMKEPSTILEFLIALSYRMDEILFEPGERTKVDSLFWEMVHNLGLEAGEIEKNERILRNLLERKYGRKGQGGLFPLKETSTDQRKVEIWYQMMSYLEENY